jgi:hypothetical protein
VTDPSRINDPAVRALSRQLVDMQRRLDRIEKGSRSTQLSRSSIEDGYLQVNDGTGNPRVRIGRQPDGKFGWGAVNGDPPPRPNTPSLVGTTAGFNILWNGEFAGIKPSDFTYTVAYASPAGDTFIVDDSLIVGRLFGAGVIPVTAIAGLPIDPLLSYWVRLVSYNSSGVASEESFTAGPVQSEPVVATEVLDGIVDTLALADDAVTAAKIAVAQIGLEHVTFTAADLGSIVTYAQDDAPTGTIATGSLWLDTNDGNKLRRWDGDSWELATDADIAAALAAATAAQSDAADALLAATNAEAAVDGKVTVYYDAAAPVGSNEGDLWIDTDNDNLLSRWDGDSWEPVDDQRIADALTAAATAQSTADGKIVSFWQDTEPTAEGVGDLWYDTDAGNRASRWNGTTWTALPAGTDAIDDDAITSSKVVAEAIQSLHIAAENIFGSHIAAGTITGDKIEALSIVAGHIAANAIETGHLAAGAVTADKLEAILVLASQIIVGDAAGWHLELGDSNTPILFWNGTETGFAVSRDAATGQANVYLSGRVEFGNGSQIEQDYLDLAEQPSSGFQTPTVRQQRTWINSGPTTGVTAQWQSATQKGSLCLMAVWQTGTGGTTPNCGTPAGATIIDSRVSGLDRLTLFYVPNSPTSRTAEAFGSSAGPAKWAIALVEYTGLAAAPLDVQAFATGTGTTAASGTTATTTQAAELQFAVFGAGNIGFTNGKFGQWTAPTNGFTKILEADGTGGQGIAVTAKIATGTGAASTALTANKSVSWIGQIATFKSAVAAGVPPTPRDGTLRVFARERAGYATPHVIDDTGAIYPFGRKPYCRVEFTGAGAAGVTAGVDLYAQGDWTPVADPYSLVAIGTGGVFSNITIPISGYYLINYRTNWQISTGAGVPVNFVTRNTRAASASILRATAEFMNGANDGSTCLASRVVPLTAGDILYWGNYCNVTASFYRLGVDSGGTQAALNVPTEIEVFYWGPA